MSNSVIRCLETSRSLEEDLSFVKSEEPPANANPAVELGQKPRNAGPQELGAGRKAAGLVPGASTGSTVFYIGPGRLISVV